MNTLEEYLKGLAAQGWFVELHNEGTGWTARLCRGAELYRSTGRTPYDALHAAVTEAI